MLGHQPYYHRSIRKYVVIFGSMFNDIFYVRETAAGEKKERQKVPIAYGPKEKWVTRIYADPSLTKSVATTVPRMSFELAGMTYDESRKQQSTIRHRGTNPSSNSTPHSQYVGVPYNFDFTMSIYVRNVEDGLQIVEQILPFFLPDYTVSALVSEELDIIKDIPIILKSVNENISYEGSFADGTRIVTWDLTFTLKGFLFGPVSNTAIIMGVAGAGNTVNGGIFINMFIDVNNNPIQKVYITTSPYGLKIGEVIRAPTVGITGTVYAWSNGTSNVSNSVYLSQMTGVLKANDEFWGLETNTHRTVLRVETANQEDVEILIRQKPISANADSDYGYTTTITEFPGTL